MTKNAGALYVGWTGQGNLGDDAIADALLPHLPGVASWHVPHDPLGFARAALREGLFGSTRRSVLLGGGTVIGRRNWRLLLTATGAALARNRPWYLIGAGVEDPSFQGRNSFSEGGELARWVRMCRRFDRITVRGPRSVRLLDSVGITAEMVGDPALLHEADGRVDAHDRLLGVNLGFGDDLWGHDHGRVVDAVAGLVRQVVTDGWRVRLLVVNPADRPAAVACLRAAGVPEKRAEIRATTTVPAYLAAVRECTVLVAERLHALVLGAVAAVPLVGLEYQPKCADFLESVGAGDLSVRTDRVTTAALRDRVADLDGRRAAESGRLAERVSLLREALRRELDRIRAGLSDLATVDTPVPWGTR
jgi:polysaccharide pyruvyl transferase WcaK-like protein